MDNELVIVYMKIDQSELKGLMKFPLTGEADWKAVREWKAKGWVDITEDEYNALSHRETGLAVREDDDLLAMQARRIVELENQVADLTRVNKLLMERYQQKVAEANTVLKPAEYHKGQEVAFCVKYSSGEQWYAGTVLYVGKGRVKISYKDRPRSTIWREPRFMRPIEEMPKHQGSTPYRLDAE